MSETDRRGLGEEWRPWCCPEPRCVPVHTLSGSEKPLSQAVPGETFVCFGAAPTVEFVYDGARHVNDTRSCTYTPLKGVISYQENADDWRALSNAYHLAVSALLAFRDGDEGARNRPTLPSDRRMGWEVALDALVAAAPGCGLDPEKLREKVVGIVEQYTLAQTRYEVIRHMHDSMLAEANR